MGLIEKLKRKDGGMPSRNYEPKWTARMADNDSSISAERWVPVPGYGLRYEVSSFGRIRRGLMGSRRKQPGELLSVRVSTNGYPIVDLLMDGFTTRHKIHRLVYAAFVDPIPVSLEVNHRDGFKTNNRVENLEAVTRSENLLHAFRLGLAASGEFHHAAKLTNQLVLEIRAAYIPRVFGQRKLAKRFGLTQSRICRILSRKEWAHV